MYNVLETIIVATSRAQCVMTFTHTCFTLILIKIFKKLILVRRAIMIPNSHIIP